MTFLKYEILEISAIIKNDDFFYVGDKQSWKFQWLNY